MEYPNGTSRPATARHGGLATVKVGGLAGRSSGVPDGRPPLVLLHGLSFNRAMWDPALDLLLELEPTRQVLALDLPGHGDSDAAPGYDTESVAAMVHRTVAESGLVAPVVVGHSLSAIVATVYATRYPVRGVVNVDQTLQTAGFTALLHSLAEQLKGPGFEGIWQMFEAGFHTELLDAEARELLRSTSRPTRELVTGYWREVLDSTPESMESRVDSVLAALRDKQVPYLVVAGDEPGAAYRPWLARVLPQANLVVFPQSGHFPHLADPQRFATLLAATASGT